MQTSFKKVDGWGGKRKGAGRPNRSGLQAHVSREKVDHKKPLHITMKMRKGVISLRSPIFLEEFQRAIKRAQNFGLDVNHYAILNDHIHMIVEARSNKALAKGMMSFGCKIGKLLKRLSLGSKGAFKERYHLHVLKTPTEVKNALLYVLLNHSKHRKFIAYIDQFSSGRFFDGWTKLIGKRHEPVLKWETERLAERSPDFLKPPNSWLGRVGWQRAS